jgi:hypothetical protein
MSPLAQLPTPAAPPPVHGIAVPAQSGLSLDGLVARQGELQQQLNSLRAQQSELRRLGQSSDQAVRNATRSELTQVNMQVAQVRTSLASIQAEIRTRAGITVQPQDNNNNRRDVPGEAIAAMSVVFMLAVLMPISIAFARRIWRRGSAPKPAEDVVSPRLDRLETAVDAIAIEIERISEGQRFTTKLLSERSERKPNDLPERPS